MTDAVLLQLAGMEATLLTADARLYAAAAAAELSAVSSPISAPPSEGRSHP